MDGAPNARQYNAESAFENFATTNEHHNGRCVHHRDANGGRKPKRASHPR
jgi:hypothetical protein